MIANAVDFCLCLDLSANKIELIENIKWLQNPHKQKKS